MKTRPAASPIVMTLASGVLATLFTPVSIGQSPASLDQKCPTTQSCEYACPSKRDCSVPSDTRSCDTRTIVGIRFKTAIDPVCEVAKKSQNQIYASQKSACEASKTEEQFACEEKRLQCATVADNCRTLAFMPGAAAIDRKSILWVDDTPKNNLIEQKTLEQLGAAVTVTTSTTLALEALKAKNFHLILSDVSRKDDRIGGLTLLGELKKQHSAIPVILYTSSANARNIADAKRRGAYGETNSRNELFSLVASALSGRPQ